MTGTFGALLGVSYVAGVVLGYGPAGAYAAVALQYVWMAPVVAAWFRSGDWAARATDMMADRGSVADGDPDAE